MSEEGAVWDVKSARASHLITRLPPGTKIVHIFTHVAFSRLHGLRL